MSGEEAYTRSVGLTHSKMVSGELPLEYLKSSRNVDWRIVEALLLLNVGCDIELSRR